MLPQCCLNVAQEIDLVKGEWQQRLFLFAPLPQETKCTMKLHGCQGGNRGKVVINEDHDDEEDGDEDDEEDGDEHDEDDEEENEEEEDVDEEAAPNGVQHEADSRATSLRDICTNGGTTSRFWMYTGTGPARRRDRPRGTRDDVPTGTTSTCLATTASASINQGDCSCCLNVLGQVAGNRSNT
jgi:hypothetical protein